MNPTGLACFGNGFLFTLACFTIGFLFGWAPWAIRAWRIRKAVRQGIAAFGRIMAKLPPLPPPSPPRQGQNTESGHPPPEYFPLTTPVHKGWPFKIKP